MRRRSGTRGGVAGIVGWLARPFTMALRPAYRTAKGGLLGVYDAPTLAVDDTLDALGLGRTDGDQNAIQRLTPVRARSRTLGRLFVTLLLFDLACWCWLVLVDGVGIFAPASIMRVAIGIVLGGQFLVFALTNWQARTGRRASFSAFLSDGRNFWPR